MSTIFLPEFVSLLCPNDVETIEKMDRKILLHDLICIAKRERETFVPGLSNDTVDHYLSKELYNAGNREMDISPLSISDDTFVVNKVKNKQEVQTDGLIETTIQRDTSEYSDQEESVIGEVELMFSEDCIGVDSRLKGKKGEQLVFQSLQQSLCPRGYEVFYRAESSHNGDILIRQLNKTPTFTCMIEVKNYKAKVSTAQVSKFLSDIQESRCSSAILLSLDSSIIGIDKGQCLSLDQHNGVRYALLQTNNPSFLVSIVLSMFAMNASQACYESVVYTDSLIGEIHSMEADLRLFSGMERSITNLCHDHDTNINTLRKQLAHVEIKLSSSINNVWKSLDFNTNMEIHEKTTESGRLLQLCETFQTISKDLVKLYLVGASGHLDKKGVCKRIHWSSQGVDLVLGNKKDVIECDLNEENFRLLHTTKVTVEKNRASFFLTSKTLSVAKQLLDFSSGNDSTKNLKRQKLNP